MATMTLGTVSICMTVLILNVHHRGPRYPMPAWLRRLCFTYIARIVCIQTPYSNPPSATSALVAATTGYNKRMNRAGKTRFHPVINFENNAPGSNKNGTIDDIPEVEEITKTEIQCSQLTSVTGHVPLLDNIYRRRMFTRRPLGGATVAPHGFHSNSREGIKEWHELARVLDRLFFWIIFVLMTLSATVILLFPKYTGNEVYLADT